MTEYQLQVLLANRLIAEMSLPAWKTLASVGLISTSSVDTSGHCITLIAVRPMPSTMATERQKRMLGEGFNHAFPSFEASCLSYLYFL